MGYKFIHIRCLERDSNLQPRKCLLEFDARSRPLSHHGRSSTIWFLAIQFLATFKLRGLKCSTIKQISVGLFFYFFYVVPSSEETSFWPPSMVYISVIITHITHYKSCWTFCVGRYPCTALRLSQLLIAIVKGIYHKPPKGPGALHSYEYAT